LRAFLYIFLKNLTPEKKLLSKTKDAINPLILFYYEDEKIVGFKVGYERDPGVFYSWMGGVHPNYRGKGIASILMKHQHDWAREAGFEKVHTRTDSRFPEMIKLNKKFGFKELTRIQRDSTPEKIVLELIIE
jgi:predicted GNAT superfamily acetyltransferase